MNLGSTVATALARYLRNTKKEARAKTLKKLSTVVERWITDYGAELDPATGVVSFSVPRWKVKDRFARRKPSLKLDHVGRGMTGLGTVKREGNRVTFVLYLSKIEEEGGVVVNPKTAELKLHQKHLFRQGESWHREPWETLEGINVEEACPDGVGDARRVRVQGAFGKQLTLCVARGPIAQMQLQHRPSEQLTLRSGLTGRRPRPTVSYSRVIGAFTTLSQHFWRQQQYEMVWGCHTLSI